MPSNNQHAYALRGWDLRKGQTLVSRSSSREASGSVTVSERGQPAAPEHGFSPATCGPGGRSFEDFRNSYAQKMMSTVRRLAELYSFPIR